MELSTTGVESLPSRNRLRIDRITSLVVFRALPLGDMLCAVPALRALRHRYPDASITLVGQAWAWQFVARFENYLDGFIAFPGHPALPEQKVQTDRVPAFYADVKSREFDLAIQMHDDGTVGNSVVAAFGARYVAGFCAEGAAGVLPALRSGFVPYPHRGPECVRLMQLANFLGAGSVDVLPEFPLNAADHAELAASGVADGLRPGEYICMNAGSSQRHKGWPARHFAALADQLAAAYGVRVVLTGTAEETGLVAALAGLMKTPAINAAGAMSIGAMAALISRARLLVCNDGGISHVAAGLSLPSVVIFSKADMERWGPIDRSLHRCVWDPDASQFDTVLAAACALLAQQRPAALNIAPEAEPHGVGLDGTSWQLEERREAERRTEDRRVEERKLHDCQLVDRRVRERRSGAAAQQTGPSPMH